MTMDSLFGNLLTSIVILPLTAGNYRRRQNGSWYYDGVISSRVLFLVVLAVVIMCTASKWILIHAEVRLGIVIILLSLFMVSAMFGVCILVCLVRKHGLLSVVAARRNTNTLKLHMIFLWGFGLASGLYCAFCVGKQIECLVNVASGFFWNTLFCFNNIMILCVFSQLIFITYFSSFKLKQTTLVNYVMLLLLTSNISAILFIILIHDTFSYMKSIDFDGYLSSCLESNTTMTFLKVKSQTILAPTLYEYGLLSALVLLEIWSPTENQYPDIGSRNAERGTTERTALLHDVTPLEHSSFENRGKNKVCHLITLAVSLTTGLGLVVCYVVMALDEGNLENARYVAEIYEFTLKMFMLIATFIGFFYLDNYCSPGSSCKGLKSREYVYLLSAFGTFMMHMIEAIVGDTSCGYLANIFMSTSILSVFQDYIQVVFLMYANRCKTANRRSKVAFLESIFIFIMISNFILWFNSSFFLYGFSSTRILKLDKVPKGMIDIMHFILVPVSICFRFASFIEYYATFGKYTS